MPIPDSWSQQSEKLDRKEKSAKKAATRKASGVVLEKDIQAAIVQALRLNHVQVTITDAGGSGEVKGLLARYPTWLGKALGLPQDLPFGLSLWIHVPKGFPDLLGRLPSGRWVAIEVKAKGQKPKPEQLAYLQLFREHGEIAFWTSNANDALAQLKGMDYEKI